MLILRRVLPLAAACAGCALVPVSAAAAAPVPYALSVFAGTPGTAGPVTSSQLQYPTQIAVDPAGDAFVVNSGTVDDITPDGQMTVIAGGGSETPTAGAPIAATAADLSYASGIAFAPDGGIYLAVDNASEVDEVTRDGQLTVVAGGGTTQPSPDETIDATDAQFSEPTGLAVDSAGDLYVADDDEDIVSEITPAGRLSVVAGVGREGTPQAGIATSEPLGAPEALAVNAVGDLYIADANTNEVYEVTSEGQLTFVAGTGTSGLADDGLATDSPLSNPEGLAVDGAGNLYIAEADFPVGQIAEITPQGQLTVIAGDGTAGAPVENTDATESPLNALFGVASSAAGRLYLADANDQTIDLLTTAPPVDDAAPTISGEVTVGQPLLASPGVWTNAPIVYAYQWQACDAHGGDCVDIPGATTRLHTVTHGDVGRTLRILVTAANSGGSAIAASEITAATSVLSGSPTPVTTSPVSAGGPTTTSTAVPGPPATASSAASAPGSTSGGTTAAGSETVGGGLRAAPSGRVALTLSCPAAATAACLVTATLTIAARRHDPQDSGASRRSLRRVVIARLASVRVAAGARRTVALTLTPAARSSLRARGLGRIRVAATLVNHLPDGSVARSVLDARLSLTRRPAAGAPR